MKENDINNIDTSSVENNFRIICVEYVHRPKQYQLQRRMRLFGVGPKVWKTYAMFPNHYCDTPGWSIHRDFGVHFDTYESAKNEMNEWLKITTPWKVKKISIIKKNLIWNFY